ncbi:MAG: mechanosensitive ion channel family protein [Bacteroidales bacterium]|nr:mechanosensitive ion channel family protein [Bacteroidales bacterium]MCF8388542.1 mechanosensitive ion channel family protein [Bacteroidales bacterium]MCF8397620.1 mechanosensitive ion channel family protein [Bacteroidales bacterium]
MGFIIALDIMGFGKVAASNVADVGVSAIILGFAFKDIAENFLAGILIALNRPFKVDDIIEIGSKKGPVKSID